MANSITGRKANMDDAVFINTSNPNNPKKSFVRRIITDILMAGSEARYTINRPVVTPKGEYVGISPFWFDTNGRPLVDDDFYLLGGIMPDGRRLDLSIVDLSA